MMRIGLIVNPVAGLGGRVGLKGTDGTEAAARALGAVPEAGGRAARALAILARAEPALELLTAAGAMGAQAAEAAGLRPIIRYRPASAATSAADTRSAALALEAAGAGLILFAGGDGTARDILDAIAQRVPVLGIPSGVKMHSAVFATTPEAAGRLVALLLGRGGAPIRLGEREVMDVDEEGLRAGRLSARLYGYVRVPAERRLVPPAKAGGGRSEDAALDGAAREIAR